MFKYSVCVAALFVLFTVRPSWAQTSITDIINEKDKSPFELSLEDLKARIAKMRSIVEAESVSLEQMERNLESKFQTIQSTNYDPVRFMNKFAELSAALPAEFQDQIKQRELVDLAAWTERSEQVRNLKHFVDTATGYVEPFVSSLDSYQVRSMDMAMARGILRVSEQALLVRQNTSNPKVLASLQSSFLKLDQKRQAYYDNRDLYGQPKGSFVLAPSNKFLDMLKSISKKMLKNIPGDPVVLERKNEALWKRIYSIVLRLPALGKLIGSGLRMYYHLKRNTLPTAKEVPFSSAIHDTFRNLGKVMGIELKYNGRENFPLPRHKDEVIFLNPTHRDGIKDFIAIAGLNIDQVVYFGAAGNFIPNAVQFVRKRPWDLTGIKQQTIQDLNESKSFVVVGRGKDNLKPVDSSEKGLGIVVDGRIQIVILFSEGMLPSELGGISPIQEKSFSLIELFRAAGKEVTLATLSFKHNHDPFDLYLTGSDNKRLEVDVYPGIPDRVSGTLAVFGGVKALSLLYRFGAVSSLITNDSLLFGQVRATKLEGTLDMHMRIPPSNKAIKSCLRVLSGL